MLDALPNTLAPALIDLGWSSTLRNVVFGSAILGAVGGVLGSFAVLRRQGLLGDALAHAALPGICLAFIVTGVRATPVLMLGAALSAWIGTLAILAIVRYSRVKDDAALGIVLSVFFGVGILLLTYIQRTGGAAQSGLDRFLFGQAATLLLDDVQAMAVLAVGALGLVWLLFKEFKLVSFDPDYAATIGFAPTRVSILLTSLIVVAVVIGLQTVGVVLMVAMLVAPAAAARQWTNRLGAMLLLAAAFGAGSGVIGAVLSSQIARLPTGPTIVLAATGMVGVSILLAPERGILWAAAGRYRQRRRLRQSGVLRDLAELAGSAPVTAAAIAHQRGQRLAQVTVALGRLRRQGLVQPAAGDTWAMTAAGHAHVDHLNRQERLWKEYLARQMDLPTDAVHLRADEVERVLPAEVLKELEAAAEDADLEPASGVRHSRLAESGGDR